MKPHDFSGVLTKHRQMYYYCTRCGLIGLKNEASRKAASKQCPGKED